MAIMASSAIAPLPQELVDEVIDHFIDPKRKGDDYIFDTYMNQLRASQTHNLNTCSLVCNAWLPRSRHHLFYHVSLHNEHQASSFLELLCSPLVTITSHIRRLKLYWRDTSQNFAIWWEKALHWLPVLTTIESVFIDGGDFSSLGDGAITDIFSKFPTLKALRMHKCSLATSIQLVNAISISANLECLELDRVWVVQDSPNWLSVVPTKLAVAKKDAQPAPPSICERPFSHLRLIRISDCRPIVQVLQCLQSIYAASSVETLYLSLTATDNIDGCSLLMHHLGPSLKHLHLTFRDSVDTDNNSAFGMLELSFSLSRIASLMATSIAKFIRSLALSENDQLRTIHLPSIYMCHNQQGLQLPTILAQISSPVIEEVIIYVTIISPDNLNYVSWDEIERIFARSNYSQLKRVRIDIRYPLVDTMKSSKDDVLHRLESQLLVVKGILDVEVHECLMHFSLSYPT